MKTLAKAIRILTVPPIMALVALSIIYIVSPDVFGGLMNYIAILIFITVLPFLAYPLQPIMPGFRGKGREGQRNLALLMTFLGYVSGLIYSITTHVPKGLLILFLSYFLSGIVLILINKVIKIKASGHICGVVGPVLFLSYFVGPLMLFSALLIPIVGWACLYLKRHTISQMIWGGCVSSVAFLLTLLITIKM